MSIVSSFAVAQESRRGPPSSQTESRSTGVSRVLRVCQGSPRPAAEMEHAVIEARIRPGPLVHDPAECLLRGALIGRAGNQDVVVGIAEHAIEAVAANDKVPTSHIGKKSTIFCAVVSQTYGTIRHVKVGSRPPIFDISCRATVRHSPGLSVDPMSADRSHLARCGILVVANGLLATISSIFQFVNPGLSAEFTAIRSNA
jgi:hypothetical protein